MRKLAWSMMAMLVLATPACSSGDDSGDQGSTSSANESAATNAIGLQLGEGPDRASTTFQAQDPRTHAENIEIQITPADSAITVDFVTADGGTLHVLSPPLDNNCDTADNQQTCTIRFPILEARAPGQWQAVASKPDGPPVTLNMTITWEPSSP